MPPPLLLPPLRRAAVAAAGGGRGRAGGGPLRVVPPPADACCCCCSPPPALLGRLEGPPPREPPLPPTTAPALATPPTPTPTTPGVLSVKPASRRSTVAGSGRPARRPVSGESACCVVVVGFWVVVWERGWSWVCEGAAGGEEEKGSTQHYPPAPATALPAACHRPTRAHQPRRHRYPRAAAFCPARCAAAKGCRAALLLLHHLLLPSPPSPRRDGASCSAAAQEEGRLLRSRPLPRVKVASWCVVRARVAPFVLEGRVCVGPFPARSFSGVAKKGMLLAEAVVRVNVLLLSKGQV